MNNASMKTVAGATRSRARSNGARLVVVAGTVSCEAVVTFRSGWIDERTLDGDMHANRIAYRHRQTGAHMQPHTTGCQHVDERIPSAVLDVVHSAANRVATTRRCMHRHRHFLRT